MCQVSTVTKSMSRALMVRSTDVCVCAPYIQMRVPEIHAPEPDVVALSAVLAPQQPHAGRVPVLYYQLSHGVSWLIRGEAI